MGAERAGRGDSEQQRRVLGDGVSPRTQTAPGPQDGAAGGAFLGIKGADCGLLFHCYGFKGQWGIVVSGDPIVCFRCRSQPRSGWRFPEGQAGSVCGTLNNEAGMFPSPPPFLKRHGTLQPASARPGQGTAPHSTGRGTGTTHPSGEHAEKAPPRWGRGQGGFTPQGLRSFSPSPRTPANLGQGKKPTRYLRWEPKPRLLPGATHLCSRAGRSCCAAAGRQPGEVATLQPRWTGLWPHSLPSGIYWCPLSVPAGGAPWPPCNIPVFLVPPLITQHPPKTDIPQARRARGVCSFPLQSPASPSVPRKRYLVPSKGLGKGRRSPWVLPSLFVQHPKPRTYLHSSFLCQNKPGCYAKAGGRGRSRELAPAHS